jgi:hypothetical protein
MIDLRPRAQAAGFGFQFLARGSQFSASYEMVDLRLFAA